MNIYVINMYICTNMYINKYANMYISINVFMNSV